MQLSPGMRDGFRFTRKDQRGETEGKRKWTWLGRDVLGAHSRGRECDEEIVVQRWVVGHTPDMELPDFS